MCGESSDGLGRPVGPREREATEALDGDSCGAQECAGYANHTGDWEVTAGGEGRGGLWGLLHGGNAVAIVTGGCAANGVSLVVLRGGETRIRRADPLSVS